MYRKNCDDSRRIQSSEARANNIMAAPTRLYIENRSCHAREYPCQLCAGRFATYVLLPAAAFASVVGHGKFFEMCYERLVRSLRNGDDGAFTSLQMCGVTYALNTDGGNAWPQ